MGISIPNRCRKSLAGVGRYGQWQSDLNHQGYSQFSWSDPAASARLATAGLLYDTHVGIVSKVNASE
jgi:hypothetical protein